MKCAYLTASGNISACSAPGKPYVPSLFDLKDYCKSIDHRNCPFYLRGSICTDQADNSTKEAALHAGFIFVM